MVPQERAKPSPRPKTTPPPRIDVAKYIEGRRLQEAIAIEAVAHDLEIPIEEVERRLHGGGDLQADQRMQYRKKIDEKLRILDDDGD